MGDCLEEDPVELAHSLDGYGVEGRGETGLPVEVTHPDVWPQRGRRRVGIEDSALRRDDPKRVALLYEGGVDGVHMLGAAT